MKLINLSFIATTLLSISAQNDDCSRVFSIAYEADPNGGQFCVKKTIEVENVSRSCLYNKGATTGCMRSAFYFAILQGTEENARTAAKECQCGENKSSSSATVPSPTTISTTSQTIESSSSAVFAITTTTTSVNTYPTSSPGPVKRVVN
ncbi:hypothetical protein CONCODRAFT_14891 [Conidiobolus coronatus NRRL 28638]|uniref:Uncharacterized protein n=1 Tax=Conidiobolus coronatus (strain ATCC 28846 / CBS 209.66 / NRRL 28638) TaxID=796925 RepID=A0A137PHF2_CONC2|nr:hypothetical protein CONCODRAFT_14891 [Conidiobolus coronatus NRRL 28638]|eukprot:KXN74412.1 hypothetical protein CONCODRAFT_14891 [Conidiobolus coronatus NRRL 28638]